MPLYFGMFVSVAAYLVGMALKKKLGWAILNPLLVAILLVMALLKATGISYGDYNQGASYISYFLTPATVCLAIPLYKQLELLKKNLAAVLCGILALRTSCTILQSSVSTDFYCFCFSLHNANISISFCQFPLLFLKLCYFPQTQGFYVILNCEDVRGKRPKPRYVCTGAVLWLNGIFHCIIIQVEHT